MKAWQKILLVAAPVLVVPAVYGLLALIRWLDSLAR
jgi:hypothetical protein